MKRKKKVTQVFIFAYYFLHRGLLPKVSVVELHELNPTFLVDDLGAVRGVGYDQLFVMYSKPV